MSGGLEVAFSTDEIISIGFRNKAAIYITCGGMIYPESLWVQAMSKASEEGLIFIEGTGPTYATETVMLYACPFLLVTFFWD